MMIRSRDLPHRCGDVDVAVLAVGSWVCAALAIVLLLALFSAAATPVRGDDVVVAAIPTTYEEVQAQAQSGKALFISNGIPAPSTRNQNFVRVDTDSIPQGLWCIYYKGKVELEVREGYAGPKNSVAPPITETTVVPQVYRSLAPATIVPTCTTGRCPLVK